MSFLLSCWFWFARRARRRATGPERSAGPGGSRPEWSEAERRARAVAARSIATRSDRQGAEFQARGQERRAGTVGDGVSAAFKAERCRRRPCRLSSPDVSGRSAGMVGDRAQRHAPASRGERAGTASAGPGGPGRGDHSGGGGSRAAGRAQREGAPTRRRGTKRQRLPRFVRRLRRARCQPGAAGSPWGTPGGRRRDAAQQRGAEERRRRRGLAERRVPRPILRAHAAAHGAGLHRTERKRRRKQGS